MLFNAHTHLELSQLDVPLDIPSRKMDDWVPALMQFRRSEKYNAVSAIQTELNALSENMGNDTLAIADIVPPQVDVSKIIVPKNIDYIPFIELIGWTRTTAEYPVKTCLSPHAPQTVCPQLLEYAVRQQVPLAMHLAETEEELQLLRNHNGPILDMMRRVDPDYTPKKVLLGKRPMDYLQLLAQAPFVLVIHGNYLDDEELRFLAAHRDTMSVVYCPRSHAYFRHKPYPLRKMLDFGVCVLLGTDSKASVPDSDVRNEQRSLRFPPRT